MGRYIRKGMGRQQAGAISLWQVLHEVARETIEEVIKKSWRRCWVWGVMSA